MQSYAGTSGGISVRALSVIASVFGLACSASGFTLPLTCDGCERHVTAKLVWAMSTTNVRRFLLFLFAALHSSWNATRTRPPEAFATRGAAPRARVYALAAAAQPTPR